MKQEYFISICDSDGSSIWTASISSDNAFPVLGDAYYHLMVLPDAYSARVYIIDGAPATNMSLLKEFIKDQEL